jgi:glycosyltransferase involved in cell wall biosynthesis
MKRISYILPVHNEASNVSPLYSALDKALKQIAADYTFEFIFINDGSTDDSLAKLYELQKHDKRIVVINFARNFGHQMAVTAGLDYTKADAAIIMDSDLQDPPEVSLQLIRQWEAGFKVVYAQRRTRQDGFLKKLSANIFYRTLRKLAEIDIPRNTGDFRLIDRKVIDALGQFREHNRFLRGLVSYVGFTQTAVMFDRDRRLSGTTSYPFNKMLKFAADGIFSFSAFPLKLISRVGYLISTLSFLGILYALLVKILDPKTVVPGWTFIMIAVLLVGGMQLIVLGVLGSYIGRIYTESQDRPLYIIESVVDSKNK